MVVVWGTGPVRSTTVSALTRDAANTTAPAASASAHTALRTFLLMGTLSFKGRFWLRAVRKENRAQRSHFLRENFAALCSESLYWRRYGWPCHTRSAGSANCPERSLLCGGAGTTSR